MGLRAEKKRRARAAIIENAIALFRQHGFDAARVRDIAARSEVSEATVFNYFPSKDALCSAWAAGLLERSLGSGGDTGGAAGLRGRLRGLATSLAAELDAERDLAASLWERVRLGTLDVPGVLVDLVRAAQESGELRRDLEARELAGILWSVLAAGVGDGLRAGEARGVLAGRLRRGLDLVLDGSRRRHERVRMGAARTTGAALSTR